MRDDLMRRISDALDSEEGITGDAELGKILAGDKVASRYARDMARVNKWLATWPTTTPADGPMAALTARIEQRLDEPLLGTEDLTAAPNFDDDDALAEATAALTGAGTAAKAKAKATFKIPSPNRPVAAGSSKLDAPGPPKVEAAVPRIDAPRPGAPPVMTPAQAAATPAAAAPSPAKAVAAIRAPLKPIVTAPALASSAQSPEAARSEPDSGTSTRAEASATAEATATAEASAAAEAAATAEASATAEAEREAAALDAALGEPRSSLAKVVIAKKAIVGGVHEEAPAAATDPRSESNAAIPELGPTSDPGIVLSSPGIEITPDELAALNAAAPRAQPVSEAPTAPPKSLRPKNKVAESADGAEGASERISSPGGRPKRKKRDSGDRFSIPMPEPLHSAPRFGEPAVAMTPEPPRRSYATWGLLAAAAVVFLGVAASMQLGSRDAEPTAAATSRLPAVASVTPAAPAAVAVPAPADDARDREGLLAEAAPVPAVPPAIVPPARIGGGLAPEAARPYAGSAPMGGAAVAGTTADLGDDPLAARRGRSAPGPATGSPTVTADPAPLPRSSGGSGASTESEDTAGSAGTRTGSSAAESPPTTAPPSSGGRAAEPPDEEIADADLTPHPDRESVARVLSGVADAVAACGAGEHGTASVFVVVVSSGRVTTATVSGRFAGTPVGSCIARTVRTAHFPRFSEPRFEVTYPYSF